MASTENQPIAETGFTEVEQRALEAFRNNPELLEHLLGGSAEIRAAALGTIFSQPEYVDRSMLSLGEFTQVAEKTSLACLEVIALRKNPQTGNTQTLLYQRPETDPWWPNEFHSAGTVILKADLEQGKLPFGRILNENGELKGGIHTTGEPVFVRQELRGAEDTGRGAELADVYYVEAEGDKPVVGEWVDVNDEFPGNAGGTVIEHHIDMIRAAAARFEADKAEQHASVLATAAGAAALHQEQ